MLILLKIDDKAIIIDICNFFTGVNDMQTVYDFMGQNKVDRLLNRQGCQDVVYGPFGEVVEDLLRTNPKKLKLEEGELEKGIFLTPRYEHGEVLVYVAYDLRFFPDAFLSKLTPESTRHGQGALYEGFELCKRLGIGTFGVVKTISPELYPLIFEHYVPRASDFADL